MSDLTNVTGIGPGLAAALAEKGIKSLKMLADSSDKTLGEVRGISPARATAFIASARELLAAPAKENTPAEASKEVKKGEKNKGVKKDKKKKKKKGKKSKK
jgi:predicted RecB family nuclease